MGVTSGSKRMSALITGANRGIGLAIATKFAENEIDLILTSRSDDLEFHEICLNLGIKFGINVTPMKLDLVDLTSIKSLVTTISKLENVPSILVNNAGHAVGGRFQMTTVSQMTEMWETNVRGVFVLSQGISRIFAKNGGGVITNLSSVATFRPQEGMASYASSKIAINYLTKVMAIELASLKISVLAVAPGVTETDMMREIDFRVLEGMLSMNPNKRANSPKEVADVVFQTIKPNNPYHSGDIIVIDGGEVTNVY